MQTGDILESHMMSKGTHVGKNGWKTGKELKSQLDLIPKGYIWMYMLAVYMTGFMYGLSSFP